MRAIPQLNLNKELMQLALSSELSTCEINGVIYQCSVAPLKITVFPGKMICTVYTLLASMTSINL